MLILICGLFRAKAKLIGSRGLVAGNRGNCPPSPVVCGELLLIVKGGGSHAAVFMSLPGERLAST